MTLIQETVETDLPLEQVFAFVADFTNIDEWDPGVTRSVKRSDGPLAVGTVYDVDVNYGGRTIPMTYTVTDYRPNEQVVLIGEGSTVYAVDTIEFAETPTGTRVVYSADLSMKGLLRLAQPFLGKKFAEIGTSAAAGMQDRLERLAARS